MLMCILMRHTHTQMHTHAQTHTHNKPVCIVIKHNLCVSLEHKTLKKSEIISKKVNNRRVVCVCVCVFPLT